MKKNILIIIILALIFQGCDLFFDIDDTENTSKLSIKPTITILGEPVVELTVGSSFVDEGAEAFSGEEACEWYVETVSIETQGDTIVFENVNTSAEGYYVIAYTAENIYEWKSYAYRAVLVHDGTPYWDQVGGENISGSYETGPAGALSLSEISKHEINGYWKATNIWDKTVDFPIIFADNKDGTFGIVPGEHPVKGRYFGSGFYDLEEDPRTIQFKLTIIPYEGDPYTVTPNVWRKQ